MKTFLEFRALCPDHVIHGSHHLCRRAAIPAACEECGAYLAYALNAESIESINDFLNEASRLFVAITQDSGIYCEKEAE